MFSPWDSSPFLYGMIALIVVHYGYKWLNSSRYKLQDIPAVGSSSYLLSFYYALQNQSDSRRMLQAGYDKYRDSAFRIPLLLRWEVIIAGPKLVEEFWEMGDDELSFKDALSEQLQTLHTIGPDVHHNDYHIQIIRSQLTRNLSALFPDIRDEISTAFSELIPPSQDWTTIVALPTLIQIVCRTSNRIFIGLPTCRDSDYCALNIQYTTDVARGAGILRLLPEVLRPLAKHFVTNLPSRLAQAVKHLEPVIKERYRLLEKYGDKWNEKPCHSHQFIGFTAALYRLAAHSEYMAPLRAEVEAVIKSDGWTKAALQKMRKVDSFFRECQRYQGFGAGNNSLEHLNRLSRKSFDRAFVVSSRRRARKDLQFSDGTRIPKGTFVSISSMSIHRDSEYYDNPDIFNPWRFSDLREEEMLKHQMVATSNAYLPFGHGRHACPGRFFAANELKCMMAHLVLNYDVKMEQEGAMPEPMTFEFSIIPNPKAKVLFRKRREF
ncbi:hypothetical protein NLI96_g2200 [Meripilus lineatus]|uniref:Cytochrome P450 n=1 Tax=Meripilus lineatus TaxID=2056292 RepID=A0AAD5VEJ1_9APHY|nr:hypothetical protein NLI96_g2200 [Physisporinus lineatus]